MAKLLFKEGSFKILSDNVGRLSPEETNRLIKTAGTTCYQARETSAKSPEDFIKMLQKRGHFSVLEHSWFCFRLFSESRLINWDEILAELYKSNSLFCISECSRGLIVSGNSRIFNEAYVKRPNEIAGSILSALHRENPVLFPKNDLKTSSFLKLERNPLLVFTNDILTHRAMTVEFNNHCIGFTREIDRHRNGDKQTASYSQESTRYVDYAKGDENLDEFQIKQVLPYSDRLDFKGTRVSIAIPGGEQVSVILPDGSVARGTLLGGQKIKVNVQEFTDMDEDFYRGLRKNNWAPEEARQWLFLGLTSQMVQTCNLSEWRHLFFMRVAKPAHPEARWAAVGLLKEAQKRFSLLFDDFAIKTADDGSEFAVYTGSEKLV